MLHFKRHLLPDPAERYIEWLSRDHSPNYVSLHRAAISHFHRYILQFKLLMENLDGTNEADFDEDLARHNLSRATRKAHTSHVNLYLRWLERNGFLRAGVADKVFPTYNRKPIKAKTIELPELAKNFLEVMSATYRPATIQAYRSCLRAFYHLHASTKRKPYDINRTDVEKFMIYLYKKEMKVNNRGTRLLSLRKYLDWLKDHKKLSVDVDELVKIEDLPRREHSLPKPFAPEVDLEIQKRLEEMGDIDALGILFMRKCGLRIGELRNLTVQSVQQDLNQNYFLNVPMGKLKTERVVPLDPKAVEIFYRIKAFHEKRKPLSNGRVPYLVSHERGDRRRTRTHLADVLHGACKGLKIPGNTNLHRLRHTFATSLLSAGLPLQCLKELLGHTDIKMTLIYAAVTQETLRRDYFDALTKIQSRYETAKYSIQIPGLGDGLLQAFGDLNKAIRRSSRERDGIDHKRLARITSRLSFLQHEVSLLLNIKTTTKQKS